MNKAAENLAKAIVKDGHVELKSNIRKEAATYLDSMDLVRFYEKDGETWVKAKGRPGLDALEALVG